MKNLFKNPVVRVIGVVCLVIVIFGSSRSATKDTAKVGSETTADKTVPSTLPVSQYPSQQHRDAYNAWYAAVSKNIKLCDDNMKLISELIDGYSKGAFGAWDAYGVTKTCYDNISGLWLYFTDLKPPATLSAEHQKALTEGISAIRTCQHERRAGLAALLEFFDSPSPSKLQKASTHFTTANSFLVDGAVKVAAVELSLGIRRE